MNSQQVPEQIVQTTLPSPVDELSALWVDQAPRFGSVAAHFPDSLRKRRFVASFWAPELVLFGNWYLAEYNTFAYTRPQLDRFCAHRVDRAPATCRTGFSWEETEEVEAHRLAVPPAFWSPELPEVEQVGISMCAPAAVGRQLVRTTLWLRLLPPVDIWTVRALSAFLLLLCLSIPASAQTLFGVVSRVSDGDTLTVGKTRVRLYGIDAPEGKQTCQDGRNQVYRCGDRAKALLLALAAPGTSISCRVMDTDRYGRLVAICSSASRAGSDLGREMVVAGWAVAYRKYSTRYVADEIGAHNERRGMWAGSFAQPEEWRRGGGR